MEELRQLRVAIVTTDGFEMEQLCGSLLALQDAAADVEILALHPGEIHGCVGSGSTGSDVLASRSVEQVTPSDFDAIVLPGGKRSADRLRFEPSIVSFVKACHQAGKPIAAIGDSVAVLLAAGLVRGRNVTASPALAEELRAAGACWADKPVVTDGHWITARGTEDLAAFLRETIAVFSRSGPQVVQVAESA